MKICPECEEEKELTEFHNMKGAKDGKQTYCKPCQNAMIVAYMKTPERKLIDRDLWLKRNYGLSLKGYNQMLLDQNGKCAICGKHQKELDRAMCVDHNHETGKVRGLLCRKCNIMIGNADEDAAILLSAIEYIKEHNDDPA
ncbi:hypothetical protein LCGC14_0607620 [marine sediment metagenome]|uniref:Recombination endonuclease VII n=1 Tax=marine sediment metagenome TaxID=412755 RepID=A0A0F9R8R8_9ZZZZ